jgi:hypothetical protein
MFDVRNGIVNTMEGSMAMLPDNTCGVKLYEHMVNIFILKI